MEIAHTHQFHSLGLDRSTRTQQAEMTVDKHSLISCMWAHVSWFLWEVPALCLDSIVCPLQPHRVEGQQTRNKSQHRKLNLEKTFFLLFLLGIEPANFRSLLYQLSRPQSKLHSCTEVFKLYNYGVILTCQLVQTYLQQSEYITFKQNIQSRKCTTLTWT